MAGIRFLGVPEKDILVHIAPREFEEKKAQFVL